MGNGQEIDALCTFVQASSKVLIWALSDKSGDFQCKAFGPTAQQLSPILRKGSAYRISNVKVKETDSGYARASELEALVEDPASVVLLNDDSKIFFDLPQESKYYRLEQLPELGRNMIINVECKILDMKEVEEGGTPGNAKRVLVIADASKKQVELTLWGDLANKRELSIGNWYRFKHTKVTTYNVRSLSSTVHTEIQVIETTGMDDEDEQLLNEAFSKLSTETTISKLQNKPAPKVPRDVQFKGIVAFAHINEKDRVYYIDKQTKKKKYCLKVEVQDPEDKSLTQTCLLFDKAGKQLLGVGVNKFLMQRRDDGLSQFLKKIKADGKQYVFKGKYGEDTYNGNTKVQCIINNLWEHTALQGLAA